MEGEEGRRTAGRWGVYNAQLDAVLGKQRLLWSLLNDSFDSFGFDCPTVPTPEIHIGAGMARHGNVVVDTNYNWNCMRLAAGLVPADCWLLPALDSAFPPAQQLGQFFIIFMLHLAHVLIKSSPESPVGSVRVGWVRNGNGCAATEQEDRWLHFESGTCM